MSALSEALLTEGCRRLLLPRCLCSRRRCCREQQGAASPGGRQPGPRPRPCQRRRGGSRGLQAEQRHVRTRPPRVASFFGSSRQEAPSDRRRVIAAAAEAPGGPSAAADDGRASARPPRQGRSVAAGSGEEQQAVPRGRPAGAAPRCRVCGLLRLGALGGRLRRRRGAPAPPPAAAAAADPDASWGRTAAAKGQRRQSLQRGCGSRGRRRRSSRTGGRARLKRQQQGAAAGLPLLRGDVVAYLSDDGADLRETDDGDAAPGDFWSSGRRAVTPKPGFTRAGDRPTRTQHNRKRVFSGRILESSGGHQNFHHQKSAEDRQKLL